MNIKEIPSLERKLATLIRLFGEPDGDGWVLNIPLAEVAKTPKDMVVIACDNPGFACTPTKNNPYGINPQVGLAAFVPDKRPKRKAARA